MKGHYIAIGEAAHLLGLSVQRVRALVDSGRLPGERTVYGMRLVNAEAVDRMAQERKRDRAGTER